MSRSEKTKLWENFSNHVIAHIEEYVVPQYGDEGDDPAATYSFEDCIKQAQRYLARAMTNARPEGLERDMRKVAHWTQMAWDRIPKVTITT